MLGPCSTTTTIYSYTQSTPVGSLQTGHEVIVSPNRDKHTPANKVKEPSLLSKLFTCSFWRHWSARTNTNLRRQIYTKRKWNFLGFFLLNRHDLTDFYLKKKQKCQLFFIEIIFHCNFTSILFHCIFIFILICIIKFLVSFLLSLFLSLYLSIPNCY